MKRTNLLALLVISLCCLSASSTWGQARKIPDRVRATKTIQGSFVKFEFGDYLHATIKTNSGEERSFFLNKQGLDYFLAVHKGEPLEFTYQIVDTYIPEAGGRQKIERLVSAKAGKLTSEAWWKSARRKSTLQQLRDKYGPLVEKATGNP